MDNIRCNKFLKVYCKKNNIGASLVSLDARKAFDSVDHGYIDEILYQYGFGTNFRNYFKILYNRLTARILVNGFLSEKIDIERGVKQGDALSCAIFILCIDPLIRNLNKNSKIKPITITSKLSKITIQHKASGFADDVSVACHNDQESIEEIFSEYQKLTDRSGLTLNADKTEILNLNVNKKSVKYVVKYEGKKIEINCVTQLKICGIYFCESDDEDHKLNVLDKIDKLKLNLKKWQTRNLTLEGKSLILKTFGISQLIYNMQCIHFEENILVNIERIIFGYLWGSKQLESSKAKDRIKRSIMKNDYDKGGLKITDIECLDKSLKLRQYIRANISSHPIAKIQQFNVEKTGLKTTMNQEFCIVDGTESICKTAQITINLITDMNRRLAYREREECITSTLAINQIATINIETYLNRKGKVFLNCLFIPFRKEGIETYHDLIFAAETEVNERKLKNLETVINAFPKYFRDAANSFDENINSSLENMTHLLDSKAIWVPISEIKTNQLQIMLKEAMSKTECINLEKYLSKDISEKIDCLKFRRNCKNPKLRNMYFRLVHNDFYTYEKMFKYRMTESPNCPRCNLKETSKHMLWECKDSRIIWETYNETLHDENHKIKKYEDIFITDDLAILSTIKMKIVNELIQIIRPTGWGKERMTNLIKNLRNMELYNAAKNNTLSKTQRKWDPIKNQNIIVNTNIN
jgi:hypothetical protein